MMSGSIFSKEFWKGAAERAIKTYAQTFGGACLALMGVETLPQGHEIIDAMNSLSGSAIWSVALFSLLPAIISLCTSICSPDFVAGVDKDNVNRLCEETDIALAQLTAAGEALESAAREQATASNTTAKRAEDFENIGNVEAKERP